MIGAYGKAVVEERLKSRRNSGLAAYLRWEYGPGTDPAWVLAEANGALRTRTPRKANGGVLRAVVTAAKVLVRGNEDGRKAKVAPSTR